LKINLLMKFRLTVTNALHVGTFLRALAIAAIDFNEAE